MSGETGPLRDQMDELFGRHLLTKNKDGDLVPLADRERAQRIRIALLQPDAPVDEGTADTKIDKQMAQINNSRDSSISKSKKKTQSLDMRKGGLVRK